MGELKHVQVNLPSSSRINSRKEVAPHILAFFIRYCTQLFGVQILFLFSRPWNSQWPSNGPHEKGWASQGKSETCCSSWDTQQVSSHLYVMYKCNHRYICNHAGDKWEQGTPPCFSYFAIQIKTTTFGAKLIKPHCDWNSLEWIRHNASSFCSAPCEWIISSISKLNLSFVFQIQKIVKRTHIRSFTDIQDCNVAVTIYINTLWRECLLPS